MGFSKSARWGFFVLTLLNLLNYTDRYVVAAVVESLKKSELHLSDSQAGSLMSSFIIVYMLTSPIFGYLGDRFSRTKLIAFGVGVWSFATALGGFAGSYISLFLSRATVGIGEAAYGTIAPPLLTDYFPKAVRGRMFAGFFAAIPIGSALGYLLGGLIDHHYGWRHAFWFVGFPGVVLSLLVLTLADPPRGCLDEPSLPRTGTARSGYMDLIRNRPYLFTLFGYAAYTFALGGLAFWMPAFLERVRGVPTKDATVQFGGIIIVTGFVGTFIGGAAGDYFLRFSKQSYLWISGISSLLAVPAAYVALTATARGTYISAIIIAEILLFLSTGPINSFIVNIVPPLERATAMAGCTFLIHLLGDVPSPVIIGAISDSSSLEKGVLIVPVAIFISALIWIGTAWKLEVSG